ncbi:uncharacterized protein LOC119433508 isoform X1 [Dermacentor silvarum]|uniref:uncharacterized protein LOC119433508 isoform X1 n=1 Tax=Dermacentor silvarum TaxID=543639 RepID=UPI0021014BFA|nr:uncharacterized protein LOC119433508 isoform X1 [Dermacentor silvarum]
MDAAEVATSIGAFARRHVARSQNSFLCISWECVAAAVSSEFEAPKMCTRKHDERRRRWENTDKGSRPLGTRNLYGIALFLWPKELCPASTYGRGVCLPCPPNTYNLKAGSAYCQPCPPGAYVGTQCHPADSALQLSLVALVMKYGFITSSSLSLILGFILFWLKTRRNARLKAVPTSLLTSSLSDEFLSSRVLSCGSFELPPKTSSPESDCDVTCVGAGDARRPSRRATTRTTKKTSSSSTRTARARVGVDDSREGDDDEEGASSDDSSAVGDGAGGDASPNKRQQILKRLKEHGAVLPVKGVDIIEISEKAKQFRARPMLK